MEMAGGGIMHVYPPEDEGPHQHGKEDNWQESVVLVWWDLSQSIGGFMRIGHEPNSNGGEAILWTHIAAAGHVFHRVSTVPLGPHDLLNDGFGADHEALSFRYRGQCEWRVCEPDLDVALKLEDFHAAIDGYRKDGKSQIGDVGPQHVEVACRVTGAVTVKGSTFTVDGLGIRDHGWGPRDWDSILAHRWITGVFDRDNSFCALTMHNTRDQIIKFGWVVRGDKVIYADAVDVLSYVECDACTNRGGRVVMTLRGGEIFEAHLEPLAPGSLANHRSLACMDTLCRVRWGEKIGIGDFETTQNLQAGRRKPTVLDGGIATNGWHKNAPRL